MDLETRFRSLLLIFAKNHTHSNPRRIYDAWQLAVRAHGKLFLKAGADRRKSGESYLFHPLAAATILAEWGMDASTIAAGLLHDCVEDTDVSLDEIRISFGDTGDLIAKIVDAVTKVKSPNTSSTALRAAYLRKMLTATLQDLRVPIVKLADRLHNMRTLEAMPPHKRVSISQETLDIYCPLAHTLGMAHLRRELEDLSFRYMNPETYSQIVSALDEIRPNAERQLKKIENAVKKKSPKEHISKVTTRLKSVYSISESLSAGSITLKTLDRSKNLLKVVIVCPEESSCYQLLHVIRTWNAHELSRDGIHAPRRNGFGALLEWRRITGGLPFEAQIYSESLYRTAEYGVAADWHYKPEQKVSPKLQQSVAGLESVLRSLLRIKDDDEFLRDFNSELNRNEIYVRLKNGERIFLPRDATPIDVAYAISSHLGDEAVGCSVNDRDFPLTEALKNGDRVEIFSTPGKTPDPAWEHQVKTSRAKTSIRHRLNKLREKDVSTESAATGKRNLLRAARRFNVDLDIVDIAILSKLAIEFELEHINELYRDIGYGKISYQLAVGKLVSLLPE